MSLTLFAVGAHMDDAEYGIGGILIQAVQAGHRVVVAVTASDYSTWPVRDWPAKPLGAQRWRPALVNSVHLGGLE